MFTFLCNYHSWANHVPSTHCMIVTSYIRPSYVSVMSQKISTCHAPFLIIIFQLAPFWFIFVLFQMCRRPHIWNKIKCKLLEAFYFLLDMRTALRAAVKPEVVMVVLIVVFSRSGHYECDDCGRKFTRSGELNRHYREVHFVSTDDEEY